ncbi:hypothetical protein GA0115246_113164, partial [Streptomyces sp. SolWspMP-sol7th]
MGARRRRGGALRLARGALRLPGERAEPLRDGGLLAVRGTALALQLLQDRRGVGATCRGVLLRLGERGAPYGQLLQLGGRLVHGRLHLDQARRPGGTALREVRAEDVALRGDRDEPGVRTDEGERVVERADRDHAAQQAAYGAEQVFGAAHEVGEGAARDVEGAGRSTVSGASVVAASRESGDVATRWASWGRGRRGVVGAGGRAVGDVARAGVACAGCPRRRRGPPRTSRGAGTSRTSACDVASCVAPARDVATWSGSATFLPA